MGGKNKPNRTKNNAKPSSSARSAELLANQPTTFLGFGIASAKCPVPTFAPVDLDAHSGTFQIVLKKMTKKDATTKLKALQEFSELCQESDTDSVKAILPFWARLYCQLCGDADHRVREAAHISHKSVIAKVKKHLAPYLKEIIGPWFTAQFDTHAPAGSAAVAAFQEAFSSQKFAEAIAFCQDGILAYYFENLTVHTPQSLANSKTCSSDEMEKKYRRVVTASLLGYASYLQKLTKEQITACEEANRKLISSAKFWKLGHNKDPLIRHGFYTVLGSVCEHASWLVQSEAAHLSAMLFNSSGEDDPLVLPVLWDALLIGIVAVPECWKYGNVTKQLFQILKSGGRGHATNIFPKILPLLSAIPTDKMGDKSKFLNALFSNMREGMAEPSVGRSRSESLTVARTFVESFQYFIMLSRDDTPLVEQLIQDHLLATIKSKLFELPPLRGTTIPFFCHVAQLVRSWCKNISSYNTPVTQFWDGTRTIFHDCLETEPFGDSSEMVLQFMGVLQNSQQFLPKNGKDRVKFSDDGQTHDVAEKTESDQVFDTHLNYLAESLADAFIEKFQANGDQRVLDIYLRLKKMFPRFENCGTEKLCVLFYSLVEKSYPAGILTDLCMLMVPYVDEESAEKMLTTLSDLEDLDLLQYCKLLPCSNQHIIDWIQKDNFKKVYFNLLDQYLLGEVDVDAAIGLCKFLKPTLMLGPVMYGELLKKLTWAVSADEVVHARIKIILEDANWDICLSKEFREFAIEVFTEYCVKGEDFAKILNLTLRKIRCLWPEEMLWDDLIEDFMKRLPEKPWDVDFLLKAVNYVVYVAFDVDLTIMCEACEFRGVAEMVQKFLIFPQDLRGCGEQLKRAVLDSKEVLGETTWKYFDLKERSTRFQETWPDNQTIEELDGEHRAAFRESLVRNLDNPGLEIPIVQKFLQWIQFSCMMLSGVVGAYPCKAKAFNIPENCGNDSAADEEYPDEELLAPIMNQILDTVEYVTTLGLFLSCCTEMEFHPIVASQYPTLVKQTHHLVSVTTSSDYATLSRICADLVTYHPFWHSLRTILPNIFDRDFPDQQNELVSLETIEDTLLKIGEPEGLIKFAVLVKENSECFTFDIWNKVFVDLDTQLRKTDACEESLQKLGAIGNLFLSIQQYLKSCEENETQRELVLVWKNVAEKELWLQLYYKWRQFANVWKPNHDEPGIRKPASSALRRFCEAFSAGLDFKPKEDSGQLIDEFVPLLLSSQACVQTTAFDVLLRLTDDWAQEDLEQFQSNVTEPVDNEDKWLVNQKMDCEWKMGMLSEVLTISQTVIEALLSDFKPGDTCTIQPFTDAFTYARGYLLIWSLVFKLCSSAHFALRLQYANWLKRQGHMWILFDSVIKLMPANAVHGEPVRELSFLFKNPRELKLQEAPCSLWIEHRACHVFRMGLQWVAGAAREWWSELEPPVANLVGRIASDHVSPILIAAELKAVQNYSDSTMMITVSHQAREIIANYHIDDTNVQLALNVPPNYPLGTIRVESKTQNFVHRTLRVSLFLANRNCSLCDALLLWKSELDKRFEGIEPCHICYSLFYGGNCDLPKPACSTCHKKFHSACLYKWFDTSNKSTCPYCRNKF